MQNLDAIFIAAAIGQLLAGLIGAAVVYWCIKGLFSSKKVAGDVKTRATPKLRNTAIILALVSVGLVTLLAYTAHEVRKGYQAEVSIPTGIEWKLNWDFDNDRPPTSEEVGTPACLILQRELETQNKLNGTNFPTTCADKDVAARAREMQRKALDAVFFGDRNR